MKSLLMLLGKGKGEDSEPSEDDSESSPERSYAREAFSALKDDDEEGFVEAFISAVRACSKKSKSDGYDDDAA
jgi:hypothetical protein